MFEPFPDLSKLSEEDLMTKIDEMNKRIYMVQISSSNYNVIKQLVNAQTLLKQELQERKIIQTMKKGDEDNPYKDGVVFDSSSYGKDGKSSLTVEVKRKDEAKTRQQLRDEYKKKIEEEKNKNNEQSNK